MLQTGNEGEVRSQLTFQSLQQECCSLPRPTVVNEAEDAPSLSCSYRSRLDLSGVDAHELLETLAAWDAQDCSLNGHLVDISRLIKDLSRVRIKALACLAHALSPYSGREALFVRACSCSLWR